MKTFNLFRVLPVLAAVVLMAGRVLSAPANEGTTTNPNGTGSAPATGNQGGSGTTVSAAATPGAGTQAPAAQPAAGTTGTSGAASGNLTGSGAGGAGAPATGTAGGPAGGKATGTNPPAGSTGTTTPAGKLDLAPLKPDAVGIKLAKDTKDGLTKYMYMAQPNYSMTQEVFWGDHKLEVPVGKALKSVYLYGDESFTFVEFVGSTPDKYDVLYVKTGSEFKTYNADAQIPDTDKALKALYDKFSEVFKGEGTDKYNECQTRDDSAFYSYTLLPAMTSLVLLLATL